MSAVVAFKLLVFLVILVPAAVLDVRRNRIPNGLTVAALVLGLAFGLAEGAFYSALAGAGLALLATLPLFMFGAIGGGDGKLLMGIGAFLGPAGLVDAALYAGVLGGVLALVVAARKGIVLPLLLRAWELVLHVVTLGRYGERGELGRAGAVTIPYGLPLAAGAVAAWFLPILDGVLR